MKFKVEFETEWGDEPDLRMWLINRGFKNIQISPIYSTSEFRNLKKWDK